MTNVYNVKCKRLHIEREGVELLKFLMATAGRLPVQRWKGAHVYEVLY